MADEIEDDVTEAVGIEQEVIQEFIVFEDVTTTGAVEVKPGDETEAVDDALAVAAARDGYLFRKWNILRMPI